MLTPLPHQVEDAKFLAARKFAGCFSGMGTGKTITALEALRLVKGSDYIPSLIIAPPIALPMWAEQVEQQLGLTAKILKTGKTPICGADVYVVSYAIAAKRAGLKSHDWLAVICDESHALKSVTAKRTKNILGKGGIVEWAQHTWMLTGTPITRHNDDLFPFLCRADLPGMRRRIGGVSKDRFELRYCVTQKKMFSSRQRFPTKVVVGSRNSEELNGWLYQGGLAVRRELKEVWDAMPPITYTRLGIALDASPELRAKLAELRKMNKKQVEQGIQNNDENLATMRREIGAAKVKAATQFLFEQVDAGESPILVGAWHRDVIDALVAKLRGLEVDDRPLRVSSITGATSAHLKESLVRLFNAGEIDVLVGQIASMGVSLNLQAGGNRIVVVEEDWSPTVMDQFTARLHRMGQKKAVHVDTLVADTQLDEAVHKLSQRKARNAQVAVGVAAQ